MLKTLYTLKTLYLDTEKNHAKGEKGDRGFHKIMQNDNP